MRKKLQFNAMLCVAVLLSSVTTAYAWNALGHKVACVIAWHELSQEQQLAIVATIKRHPRFGEDFVKAMPFDNDTDEWIFQHAGTWPDIARGIKGPDRKKYDRPTWHYVNYPIVLGQGEYGRDSIPTTTKASKPQQWNVIQATKACISVIKSKAALDRKAQAYCWLFHLVADMHQPMHSTALFCERFPQGDRGGNSILTHQQGNLHAVWDNLFGRGHEPNEVKRKVFDLSLQKSLWKVDADSPIESWVQESHQLARDFAYCSEVLEAAKAEGEFQRVRLSSDYLKQAGQYADARIVAAGLRLGHLLNSLPFQKPPEARPEDDTLADFSAPPARTQPAPRPSMQAAAPQLSHWLNTNSNVRHNSRCRNFKKTKHGRMCGPDEGEPCGICGG